VIGKCVRDALNPRTIPPPATRGGKDTRVSGVSRVDWIDVARGIGIVLVVYAHAMRGVVKAGLMDRTPAYMLVDQLIYAFHMPLFFLLSGMFARYVIAGGVPAFARSRFETIVYPYLLWSLLQGLLAILAASHVNNPVHLNDLAGILLHPIAQFWFLYALFLCQLVLLLPRSWLAALVVIGAAMLLVPGLPTVLAAAGYHLLFFAAGIWLSSDRVAALLGTPRRTALIAVAAWAGFALAFWIERGALGAMPETALAVMRRLTALAGIAGTLAASRLIGQRAAWLRALGQASLAIFLVHTIVSASLRSLVVHFDPTPAIAPLVALLTIAGLGVPYLMYRIAMRWEITTWLGFGPYRPAGKREAATARLDQPAEG
jgi:fucose 4-O-acetylase-like acetyltransferase